ncbi:MAG: deoxyribose-phosphate aldolase, partial [Alphaproteobacteria bacterium]|nr:deoxyribose-phosphate aldolase [Alphaproteobacteria bacterium]
MPLASNAHGHARNPGTDLNLDWIDGLQVNFSAVQRRTSSLLGRRTVKKEWQAAWLLKALSCIDLTTLSGDDTPGRVKRLCAKARRPLRNDLVEALGIENLNLATGAVCVYHEMVP